MLLLEPFFTRVPVVAKLKVVCCEGSREQFEDSKRDAPGVHTLEDEADRFFRSLLLQCDHRDLVLLEALDDVALEVVKEPHLLAVEIPVLTVGLPPVGATEDPVHREEIRGVLTLQGGDIQSDLTAEGSSYACPRGRSVVASSRSASASTAFFMSM